MDTFITVNIVYLNDNKYELLNKNGYPILYYGYDDNEFINNFINNNSIKKILEEKCFIKGIYEKCYIKYFHFLDYEIEDFENKEISLQEIYPLSNNPNFSYQYVIDIFYSLYYDVTKKKYSETDKEYSEQILEIYDTIIHSIKRKILVETLINYLRTKIKEENEYLNENNIENILENIRILLKGND